MVTNKTNQKTGFNEIQEIVELYRDGSTMYLSWLAQF